MFWAYFTGAAFLAAGVAIALNWTARLAGTLLGLLFLLIFLCRRAPRVLTAPPCHNPDEWSSAFIAFGRCAAWWICAEYSGHKSRHPAQSPEQGFSMRPNLRRIAFVGIHVDHPAEDLRVPPATGLFACLFGDD